MTASYEYDGTPLLRVRRGSVELTQSADNLQVGSGRFVYDDTAGTMEIIGQMDFAADEDDCATPETFRGFIGEREFGGRQTERRPLAREITATLHDLNAMAGFRRLRIIGDMTKAEAGKRPAESVAARGAWLLASPFVSGLFADNGRCEFPADKGMDKADYRNQFPGDVLADMVLAALGYNVYIRDFGDGPELVFRNDNTSELDTSDVRISNVISDVTGDMDGLTFYPFKDAVLHRDPSQVISDLGYSYAGGTVTEGRAATAAAFNGERGGTASNSNVKTSAKAHDEGREVLAQRRTEEDIIDCTIQVPTSAVNLINHGDRMQARFSHLGNTGGRDYDTMTWFRVLEATKTPLLKPAALYDVRLKLSPQEEGLPVGAIVQSAFDRGTHFGVDVTLPNPVTIGNTLVCIISTKLDTNPGPPNILESNFRWGAGAWTRFNGSTKTAATDVNYGVTAWYKTADATDQTGYISEQNPAVAIYELAGADPASATIEYEDETITGPNYDIGSAQTPAVGDVAIAAWSLGPLPSPASYEWSAAPVAPVGNPVMPYQTLDPNPGVSAGWTLDYSKWLVDSTYGGYWQPASPWTVFAHALGAGSSLVARVTPGESGHTFGGLYIVIPPA